MKVFTRGPAVIPVRADRVLIALLFGNYSLVTLKRNCSIIAGYFILICHWAAASWACQVCYIHTDVLLADVISLAAVPIAFASALDQITVVMAL